MPVRAMKVTSKTAHEKTDQLFIYTFESPEHGERTIVANLTNTYDVGDVAAIALEGTFLPGVEIKLAEDREIVDKAKETLDRLEIGALVIVGGDGSLTTALQLHRLGWPVIGVPKTIDNDLQATAMTFGFDSAVSSVVEGLDRLHTTAESHKRVMVLEVMGRHAGWIALWGGIAGGASVILIPEINFDMEKVAEVIRQREEAGRHSTLVVVAELIGDYRVEIEAEALLRDEK